MVLYPIAVATCGILPVFLTGALGLQIRDDLGFDQMALGIVTSGFFTVQALISTPVGRLVEGVNPRRAMQVAALGSGGTLACVALFINSWLLLLLCLIFGGIANAVSQLASSLFLTHGISFQRQGLAFGLKEASKPAATLLCGIAVPLVGATFGWQWAFAAFALVAFTLGATVPKINRARPMTESEVRGGTFHSVPLILLAAGAGLGSAATAALGVFVVESGVTSGLSLSVAGATLATGSLVGIAVRIVLGWVADHRPMDHMRIVAGMLILGAVGFVLLAIGECLSFVAGSLLAFGAGWGWLGLFNFAIVSQHPEAPTKALGIVLTGAAGGSAAGPLLFGTVLSSTSFGIVWLGAGVGTLLAAAFMLAGKWMFVRYSTSPPRVMAQEIICPKKRSLPAPCGLLSRARPAERWFEEFRRELSNKAFESVEVLQQALGQALLPYWEEPARLRQLTGFPWWVEAVNAL
jgi:MFS family permease